MENNNVIGMIFVYFKWWYIRSSRSDTWPKNNEQKSYNPSLRVALQFAHSTDDAT